MHRDYQGSILAITNEVGSIVEKRQFDACGSLLSIQNGSSQPIANGQWLLDRGYTGHEHLQSVGLIHMNGRLYDPKLHRFLQPDNFVQDPSNTQNYNRYSYVLNNPLKYTDYSGEKWKIGWKDVVGGLQVVVGAVLLFVPGAQLIGGGLLLNGLSYFASTYEQYKVTGDWASASANSSIMFGYQTKTDWGYDSKSDKNGIAQNEPVVKPIAKDDVRNMSSGGKDKQFYGANIQLDAFKFDGSVYNRTYFGTIHTSPGFYSDYLKNGLDSDGGHVLMHEYGHYLHAQSKPLNFYSYGIISSFVTAGSSWAETNWTEIRANTMSYYYFGQPSFWRKNENPIDSNYLSKQEIFQLTHHSRPFNPFRP